MNPTITCSSCREIKCEKCFKNPDNDRVFKTCDQCRVRKLKNNKIIKDKIIEEDIKVDVNIEDNQDSVIVTTENRNMMIHLIINYLKKMRNIR